MSKKFLFENGYSLERKGSGAVLFDPEGNEVKEFKKNQSKLLCYLMEKGGLASEADINRDVFPGEMEVTQAIIKQTAHNIKLRQLTTPEDYSSNSEDEWDPQGGRISYDFKGGILTLSGKPVILDEDRRVEVPDLSPADRDIIEEKFTVEHRFGRVLADFVMRCSEGTSRFSDFDMEEQPLRCVWFSGYAGTMFLKPEYAARDQALDERSVYFQDFFEIQLRDPGFKMKIAITEPYSAGAQDAIRARKLGNDRFAGNEAAVFTSSAATLKSLLENPDSSYAHAYGKKRLQVFFTQQALPHALFLCEYKEKFHALGFRDHIKCDVYSPFITQTKTRPCFVVFKDKEPTLYGRLKGELEATFDQARSIDKVENWEWNNWKYDWDLFRKGESALKKQPVIIKGEDVKREQKNLAEKGRRPRQYFIGRPEWRQNLPYIRSDDLEMGCTIYPDDHYLNDALHYQKNASEILHVLEGEYEIMVEGDKYILKCGDFSLIPPNTPYSGRALVPGTRVLFARLGGDDKVTL